MEDFLMKEIDKIGEMLSLIASKLGLGGTTPQSEEMALQLNSELVDKLDIDIYHLLEMPQPLDYLTSERGFSNSNIESLTLMLHQTLPSSEALSAFVKNATDYLDNNGYISFELHSITN